ncbi:MAG TPA: glycoside hydrolase family 2 TIM barrel-domain containing protein [Candidatus Limnocylindria bacterium]
MTRESVQLDGEWHFVRDPRLERSAADLPHGEPITVPGCWEAQVPEPFGIVHTWYWRDIELPASWSDDGEVVVRFGAVMYRCEAWLNGRRIGAHEGGYTPFELPLRDLRHDAPNRLALLVTNPMNALDEYPGLSDERLARADARVPELPIREIPHGKQTWYASQSGLWRSVTLEYRPHRRLDRLRAGADWATGTVTARVWTSDAGEGQLELTVVDPAGNEVARSSIAAEPVITAELHVPDHLAWDVDTPNLYRLISRLRVDGEPVDEIETRFGFREVRTDEGRVVLNGRPVLLRGALDQDLYAGTISTPPGRQLLDRQLELAREMGLNLLRCHIKTPDPAYLDAADEAGVLLWCELPNWVTLTPASAARAETLLSEMVEAVADHPSVVIWTIVNEDWGTDLRHSSVDRRWLRRMAERLRAMDPTRLVVDNSACPSAGGPNFHLDTDLADFHRYAAMPDAAPRWREQMAELAERPAWLWSPHGDAVRRGEEPVVVSEFGTWGLPHPDRIRDAWWSETGDGIARPAGIAERFTAQGLDRVWPDLAALTAGTRRLQVEALRYQVGEIRRHAGMAGLVVTEFTDAYWEANGLLDVERRPKPFHDRLAQFFGPAMLIVDMPRQDLWSGEQVNVRVSVSSEWADDAGTLRWRLGSSTGSTEVGSWGAASVTVLGELQLPVPSVAETTDADLVVELSRSDGSIVATAILPCAIVPGELRRPARRRISVHDPMGVWDVAACLAADGHEIVDRPSADLIVATRLDDETLEAVGQGARLLLLARAGDALPSGLPLDRPVRVQPRWPDPLTPGADMRWTGDWIGAFSWIRPELAPNLPRRAPLDFIYAEVLPDHVLTGYDPAEHVEEVAAGMFAGWVHAPVALTWSFPQQKGRIMLTTLHVVPERGPVATVLRSALVSSL